MKFPIQVKYHGQTFTAHAERSGTYSESTMRSKPKGTKPQWRKWKLGEGMFQRWVDVNKLEILG